MLAHTTMFLTSESKSFAKKKKVSRRTDPILKKLWGQANNLSFWPNWQQFQVFMIVKFEFKVTRHNGLWEKHPVQPENI